MKKLIALLLALVMVLSLVACGGEKAPAADAPAADKPAADAPAADGAADELEFVELTWYTVGQPQAGAQEVYDKMNEYLEEKLNCHVNIITYDYGSYDEMLNLACQAGEAFDICFTSGWCFDYDQAVRKGYLLPLDDLIAQYAPDYKAELPEHYFNDAKYEGTSYSMVNYQIMAQAGGVVIRKDLADKYNFDTTQVKSLADLEPLFEAVKADDPSMYGFLPDPTGGWLLPSNTDAFNLEPAIHGSHPAYVKFVDGKATIVNLMEEPETVEQIKLLNDWYNKGYIRADSASLTDLISEEASGKYAAWKAGSCKPGCDIDQLNLTGYPCYVQRLEVWTTMRSQTIATMNGISATSKNPERAVMFLNLLWEDEYLFNLLSHGIQDVHWEWANEADKIVRNISADYNPVVEWAYGNQFDAYPREGQTATVWEETKVVNESAVPSRLNSFAFDDSNVKTENAMCNAVIEEYWFGFITGTLDAETKVPEFLQKLDDAGWDTVVAEMQAQLDAHLGQ